MQCFRYYDAVDWTMRKASMDEAMKLEIQWQVV